MLRTNVNHTTANKMPHDPALAYACKCISYYTPFCSTNLDILTFLLFFEYVNSALADFQPRCCLPLPHLPSATSSHLSFKQNITWRSLPWPPLPLIPHSLFCFLHSTWLMLFQKQSSRSSEVCVWSKSHWKLSETGHDRLKVGYYLSALSTVWSRVGHILSLMEKKGKLKEKQLSNYFPRLPWSFHNKEYNQNQCMEVEQNLPVGWAVNSTSWRQPCLFLSSQPLWQP